ncbi:MAG TPA: serine hydrolase [Thermomicrobiales bacterium]|jgi:CubicO group peptidase (beta-lactamase class C family)
MLARRCTRRQFVRQGGAGLTAGAVAAGLAGLSRRAVAAPAQAVTPESVAAAVTSLDGVIQEALDKTRVPGLAVAVVHQDAVVHLSGHGVREAGTGDPVDPDTVFQLASLSKPLAATVVAAVVGDGVVDWDARIGDLTPDFTLFDPLASREVALRDMFCHRSGLPHHGGDDLEDLGYDRAAILHRLRYLRPASSFRSTYAYTNFGLTAAAVAASAAAGLAWEDLAAERLYAPLGMTRTSSRFDDFIAAANRARGHVLVDGTYVAKYQRQPDAQSPAGGVSSTARDLAEWLRLQLGGGTVDGRGIVAAAALGETHRPHMSTNRPEHPDTERTGFYGLGWNVSYDAQGRVRLSHSGAFALGAGTAAYLVPADQLGIAVLTNAAPIGLAEAVALSFLDLAESGAVAYDYLGILGPIVAEELAPSYGTAVDYGRQPAAAAPPLALDAYAGAYANDYFGEIAVGADRGGLVLHLGPARTAYPMRHYDRDVFLYQPVGENAGGESAVSFAIGADGRATGVTIENLDRNLQGGFTRAAPTIPGAAGASATPPTRT